MAKHSLITNLPPYVYRPRKSEIRHIVSHCKLYWPSSQLLFYEGGTFCARPFRQESGDRLETTPGGPVCKDCLREMKWWNKKEPETDAS